MDYAVDRRMTWTNVDFYCTIASVVLTFAFLAWYGKKTRNITQRAKNATFAIIGTLTIAHQLIIDSGFIYKYNFDEYMNAGADGQTLVGWLAYLIGIGTILLIFNISFLKYIAPFALFAGLWVLGHQYTSYAPNKTIVSWSFTARVILLLVPGFALTVKNAQYRLKDIIISSIAIPVVLIGLYSFSIITQDHGVQGDRWMGISEYDMNLFSPSWAHDLDYSTWEYMTTLLWSLALISTYAIWIILHRSIWKRWNKDLVEFPGFLNDKMLRF